MPDLSTPMPKTGNLPGSIQEAVGTQREGFPDGGPAMGEPTLLVGEVNPLLLPARNRAKADDGYIYVVAFSSGVVKVGRTQDPRSRIGAHLYTAKATGGTISCCWVSVSHSNFEHNERALIDVMGTPCHGAEYFAGVPFEAAVAHALGLDYLVLSDEQRAQRLAGAAMKVERLKNWLDPQPGLQRMTISPNLQAWAACLLFGHEPALPATLDRELSRDHELIELISSLSVATGIPQAEIASWSYIDVLRHIGEQMVDIGIATLQMRALEAGRSDLLERDFYGLGRFGAPHFIDYCGAEPQAVDSSTSVLVTVGEVGGAERVLLMIDGGRRRTSQAFLELKQVDELIASLHDAREALAAAELTQ